MSKCVKETR